MVIHRPVRVGSVGRIDSWGFGSWADSWDYPTLGLKGIVVTSMGGIVHPRIEGVLPTYHNKAPYSPVLFWESNEPTYKLPSGRTLVAKMIDGEKCFVES